MPALTTTLNAILACGPCGQKPHPDGTLTGWRKLLRGLRKTKADDRPLRFTTILRINGLDDALWACRSAPRYNSTWRLLAVRFAREVQHLITDPRSLAALNVAERYARGKATDAEMSAARDAAFDAKGGAAWGAAFDAARAAVFDSAWAARNAAGNAAGNAAWGAAFDAAWDAEREWQREIFLTTVRTGKVPGVLPARAAGGEGAKAMTTRDERRHQLTNRLIARAAWTRTVEEERCGTASCGE